jgi:tRNA modification GTPase
MKKLEEFLDQKSSADDLILTSKRQIDSVEKALEHIDDSFTFLESGELELFAYNMNEAIHYIASITTLFERDEILDKMFGSFCLGK